jgi:hypothetical protein
VEPGTLAHIHLLLNHFPTIGTIVGLSLFVLSFIRKSEVLRHASLEVFFIIALATFATYTSGVAAQAAIKDLQGVSQPALTEHEDAALFALVFMQLTGFVAWLGLWQYRRAARMTGATSAAVMVLTTVSLLAMTRTANVGGEIRHPEIVVGGDTTAEAPAAAPAAKSWMPALAVHDFVTENKWVWPASETLHFVGLSLMFGILALVNLRMLGLFRSLSFPDVHRLLPWATLGLALNALTGMLFFIGSPLQYTNNIMFHWKMAFLMVAGANLLAITVSGQAWEVQAGEDAPAMVKAVAVSSLFLWAGVMYCGRMLAFIGGAF